MTETTRLETVEIKLAHLERSLQELGETGMRQQDNLRAYLRKVRAGHTRSSYTTATFRLRD